VRIGEVKGYQRRFCFRTEVGRGSPDNPGLMAGLEVGGSCAGLAFRIAHALVERETERLWRREMASWSYRPIWIDVATPQGPVEALTFLVNPASPNYFAHMDEDDSARLIASGTGHLGTCFAYLDNLADRLRALGLKDDAIFRLHAKAHALANGGGEGIAE
jgi:cation transport protein ChaC